MASVNSTTSAGSTNSFYNNKISGLVSGMDTETMIENMTASTRSKIAKQQQKKQLLEWKTEAMRSISDLLVNFKNKFTSFTNPATNLLSSSFFNRNQISTFGVNSKYIKATGTSNSAESLSILGVKQMASSASMTVGSASDKTMETAVFDLSADASVSSISGTSMRVKFGDKSYTISFSSSDEFNTMEDVAKAINEQFDAKEIRVNASVDANGALTFESDKGYAGNAFEITSGTGDLLKTLGIAAESKINQETSQITGSTATDFSKATGDITFTYDKKTYTVNLGSVGSMQDVADKINTAFGSDVKVKASVSDDGALVFKKDSGYETSSSFQITGGDADTLKAVGLEKETSFKSKKIVGNSYKTGEGAADDTRLKKNVSTKDILSGQSISFSYNGTTKKITLPVRKEVKDADGNVVEKIDELKDYMDAHPGYTNEFDAFKDLMQEKIDKEFGKGRIIVGSDSVSGSSGKLTFKTKDASSTFKVVSSGANVLGKNGVLGMNYGESNRINTTVSVKESGLTGASGLSAATEIKIPKLDAKGNEVKDKDGNVEYEYVGKGYEFTINGEKFQFKEDEKISNIISTINKSDAGVTMSYNETSDSFTIKANATGAAGQIDIQDVSGNLASTLFGTKNSETKVVGLEAEDVTFSDGTTGKGFEFRVGLKAYTFKETDSLNDIMTAINSDSDLDSLGIKMKYDANTGEYTLDNPSYQYISDTKGNFIEKLSAGIKEEVVTTYDRNGMTSELKAGQDAIICVDFGDGQEPMEIVRDTNTFDIDGLDITVSGKFGYDENGNIDKVAAMEDAVTFEANVDSDKAVDAVKEMVDAYNELIELVNKELTTKRDRDYPPLTDEQKEDMTENEIKLWEEKAKAGMLFNDSDIRSLSDELAMIFINTDIQALEDAGITMSSDWAENGKLSFDEEKFRAAVEADPEAISKLFAGEKNAGDAFDGVMTSMNNLCEKYAKTTGATKGILIERAGNKSAPLSLMSNSFLTEMKEIDDIIKALNERLKSERTRYSNQFTDLEVLMSQMSSQSSWLTQQFAG